MQPPTTPKVGLPFLRAKEAARLDALLMSDAVGYTLDQLMELAGQAVAHGTHALYPQGRVCVAVGPGNNGGDGLVAARHLRLLGRDVTVALPAPSRGRFAHLEKQCVAHGVPIAHSAVVPTDADVIVDAVFGFSFRPRGERGVDGELAQLIESMDTCGNPVVSVDVPSGWNVDEGDIYESASVQMPAAVISLSAPKMCIRKAHEESWFAHLIGGRFLPASVCREVGFEGIEYDGNALVVRVA